MSVMPLWKSVYFLICMINFLSFWWSVIGLFKKHPEQNLLEYRLLQLNSVCLWFGCLFAVAQSTLSDSYNLAGLALQLGSSLIFWSTSRIIKKNQFTIAFSKDQPQRLVKEGIYKFVRHPYYTAYLLSYFSVALCTQSLVVLALSITMLIIYIRAAHFEETKFSKTPFSEEYSQYKNTVGMFFPKF